MPTVEIKASIARYLTLEFSFSLIKPNKRNPAGRAISMRPVVGAGLPVITKFPALRMSVVFVSTRWKTSSADSCELIGLVAVPIVRTESQPNPELNIKKVQANKAALFQFGLRLGIHLVKK